MEEKLQLVQPVDKKMAEHSDTTLTISRHVYTHEAFNEMYAEEDDGRTIKDRVKKACQCSVPKVGRILLSYVPVVKMIRKYRLKEFIVGDILSGLTVSFMHLPQAMGFGILASLQPVHGLYSTFFPVLAYMLFGTSPYISFGTNAVMALLTQTVVEREADTFLASFNGANATMPSDEDIMNVKIGASMACCFLVGVILVAMGFLKMGILTTYLSVSFVGGFTTAAAIHIASSQIPKIFGIKVTAFAGAGKLVRMYVDLFSKIGQTKLAEVIIAVISMVILLLVKICVNERFKEKMKMPIPIDLLVCVGGTIISHFAKFNEVFDVSIVGPIPSGFTKPAVPHLENAGSFASDAFIMAILSLAMSISLAKLLANKHGQPIDDNQELVAYGAANLVSGFFHSFPSATAPPRTMILDSLGAKTTLNAVATSVFFLLVILVIGQLFVSLPLSVLAAMIIVSMKELLLQYRNLPTIWKVNKYDFIIWVVTNSVGVFVDLNYGIIAGVLISVLLTVIRDQITSGHVIALSRSEDILVKNSTNVKKRETKGIVIFRIPTNIYFATAEMIKRQIFKQIVDPKKRLKMILKKLDRVEMDELEEEVSVVNDDMKGTPDDRIERDLAGIIKPDDLKSLVLDFSVVTYIDMAGVAVFQQIVKEFKKIDVDIYIAGAAKNVVATLDAANVFANFPKSHVFVDVFDVLTALNKEFGGTACNSFLYKTRV